MRVRNRDGADAAACVYLGDCFVVQQRDAIPEQISSRRLQKQSALAYRKFRFCADAQKLRRFILEAVVMISLSSLERRPFLASVTNELPFVFANWTARRRLCSLTKLRPALHADEVFHEKNCSGQSASLYPTQHEFFGYGDDQRRDFAAGIFHETKCAI